MIGPSAPVQLDPAEVLRLSTLDPEFYCRTFFGKSTFKQKSPAFHQDIWALLEDRDHRYVGIEVFRGGAKTTLLRVFTSRRIALGISRTILFVSHSEGHSIKSLQWLRNQVERNTVWASLFGLRKGNKWTDTHFELVSDLFHHTINVLGAGITGQIRGINIDDFRPDLIVVDDPSDEENTATLEQRKKTEELFFGALQKSLTPPTECPDAKMVLLQTSLHNEDLINSCHKDSAWATRRYGCFDERGRSLWEDRFPTEFLRKEKQSHIDRNILHIFLREYECTVVSEENADFRSSWLRFWVYVPERMVTVMGLDPVPPPSERELQLGNRTKDYECLAVIGLHKGDIYLLEYAASRGHDPGWTTSEFFRLCDKWRPLRVRVEATGYQRTLKYMLDREMTARRRYVQINMHTDKRRKRHRIVQALSGIASQGHLYVHRTHGEFCSQFAAYPGVPHDDILDAVAMAIDESQGMLLDLPFENPADDEIPALTGSWREAP